MKSKLFSSLMLLTLAGGTASMLHAQQTGPKGPPPKGAPKGPPPTGAPKGPPPSHK